MYDNNSEIAENYGDDGYVDGIIEERSEFSMHGIHNNPL